MFAEHFQRHLMEGGEDEESIDDNESLPDLLDDPYDHVINDPLEGGQELDDNPVIHQRERLAIEQVLLEELGYEFEEDEKPMDPEILEAYENRVNNGENPEGFFGRIFCRPRRYGRSC